MLESLDQPAQCEADIPNHDFGMAHLKAHISRAMTHPVDAGIRATAHRTPAGILRTPHATLLQVSPASRQP